MDREQRIDVAGRNSQLGQFEERRLALELERLKFDRQRASVELLLKRREANATKTKGWKDVVTNPLTLAIVGGIVTLMTTTITSHFSASNSIDAETTKARQTLQADLIKKFVENPNPQTVRANLQFLVDVGLVPNYAESLRSFLNKSPNSALPNAFTPGTSGLQVVYTDSDAVDLVMQVEGGFVDDPADPRGATNFGITVADLTHYLGRPASTDDLRNLSAKTARDVYKKQYFIGSISAVASVHVKAAYVGLVSMAGPIQASKLLQIAVGKIDNLPVSDDGSLGPETARRINAVDPDLLIETVNCEAAKYYESDPRFNMLGSGWMRRLRMFSPVTLKGICRELQPGSSAGGTIPLKP